jgi:hypothetical protein
MLLIRLFNNKEEGKAFSLNIGIVNAPWYMNIAMINSELGIPTVQDVIHKRSNKHRVKLQSHPNPLLQPLSRDNIPWRLKRRWPTDV